MAAVEQKKQRRKTARRAPAKNADATANGTVSTADLQDLLQALKDAKRGEMSQRLSTRKAGIVGELGKAFNELAEVREKT
ncbi:MAG TPA: hypothetical protein VGQ84_12735, partial [Gaiellaceae bacterium]|nr:hypothetical protein [Gaiellaceae bacterium]